MHKIENLFSVLIITTLLSSSVYSLFIKEQEPISEIEKRNLSTTENLIQDDFFDGTFSSALEDTLADQFYNRLYFVTTKSKLNFDFGNVIYQYTDNPFVLNRIGDTPIYRIGQTNYLMSYPIEYKKEIEERILNRIEQINDLASDYPDVNFYVYKPTQITETDFFDEANQIKSAGDIYDGLFRVNLNVPYDSFDLNSFDDFPRYLYTTDHHWNHEGIYQGYKDIIQLMLNSQEDILTPWGKVCKENVSFYGTLATQTGLVTEPEPFCVYGYEMPDYTLYYKGKEMPIHYDGNNFIYTETVNNMGYHYNDAYYLVNEPLSMVELTTKAIDQENLLVIGDSYGPGLLPLLAHHYNDVYYVNPIVYMQVYDKAFTYDSFIKENNIQNVLFTYILDNYHVADEWGERYKVFDIVRD